MEKNEAETLNNQFEATKKIIEGIRAVEHPRILLCKTHFEQYDRMGSHLWKRIMRNVAEERGPWGAQDNKVYWKLDRTENKRRMRIRLKRQYNGTDHAGNLYIYNTFSITNWSPRCGKKT